MRIVNKSEPFEITYNGTTYNVPAGLYRVKTFEEAQHIVNTGIKWGKNVAIATRAQVAGAYPKPEPVEPVVKKPVAKKPVVKKKVVKKKK